MSFNIDELEQLAKEATPGAWEVDACNNIRIAPQGRPIVATTRDDEDYLPRMADAAYIVAACNAVPELINRVRELEQRIEADAKEYLDLFDRYDDLARESCKITLNFR